MKKYFNYLLFLLFVCILTSGKEVLAQNVSDVFTLKTMTWFGLDFSNARLIGSQAFPNPPDIRDNYMKSWNNLIFDEREKYDIRKIFKKSDVHFDLKLVADLNKAIDPAKLVTDDDCIISKEHVQQIVKGYNTGDAKGIGLVLIVESLNKNRDKGYMWVTFFDLATKDVLVAEKLEGEAGGAGFRNYWAKALFNILIRVNMKAWEEKYVRFK
jgi:hypothetical protein